MRVAAYHRMSAPGIEQTTTTENENVTAGMILWYHCVEFLMAYLKSESGNAVKRMAGGRESGLCGT